MIINGIDTFYRSTSLDSEEFLINYFKEKLANNEFLTKEEKKQKILQLLNISLKYIQGMIDDKIHPTFNYLLKWFHFMLDSGETKLIYDLIIFDEIQDSTGVALEIFKLLTAKYKLGLGDQDQAIYLFMNLVNGFDLLENIKIFPLTKTFRCSTVVAEAVQQFGKKYLDKDFHFIGIEHPMRDGKELYVSATNAVIVETINDLHREGKGYILTRPLKDIFAAPLAVLTASKGKAVFHKKYKYLEKEFKNYRKSRYDSFFKYLAEEVDEPEIKATVKVLSSFAAKRINLYDVLNEAKIAKKNPKRIVGTGHSLKGLGAETVHINQDLNNAVQRILDNGGPETKEDYVVFRLYYVACTRCRINLYNAEHLGSLSITSN